MLSPYLLGIGPDEKMLLKFHVDSAGGAVYNA